MKKLLALLTILTIFSLTACGGAATSVPTTEALTIIPTATETPQTNPPSSVTPLVKYGFGLVWEGVEEHQFLYTDPPIKDYTAEWDLLRSIPFQSTGQGSQPDLKFNFVKIGQPRGYIIGFVYVASYYDNGIRISAIEFATNDSGQFVHIPVTINGVSINDGGQGQGMSDFGVENLEANLAIESELDCELVEQQADGTIIAYIFACAEYGSGFPQA